MGQLLKSLRLFSDPTRVRLLLLLSKQELSVAELQQILCKGQSHISTHLAQLKAAGLVHDRRDGKSSFYSASSPSTQLLPLLAETAAEIPEASDDPQALDLVLEKRRDRARAYFDEIAGRFDRTNIPGRSWKGIAESLLALLPPLTIADLGAGEGTFSQFLSRGAKHVIAVDNSEGMVKVGTDLARKNGITNLEYRRGDLQALPIDDAEVDLAFFSQSLHHAPNPQAALAQAHRVLKPAGRIAILDLLRHQFEEARDLYADIWLGFSEVELKRWLERAGFSTPQICIVHRETEHPFLETILAVAQK